uniref:Uncharacterized protein n=1 Tax=Panagrolaimus superbus TaxID=310955 RepID=A0A914ZEV7_9BILA
MLCAACRLASTRTAPPRAAGEIELAIGCTADLDQLDALVGLRTGTAHVVDAHVGRAAGVAADDQLVGGRIIAGQHGVEGEGAAIAGEVAGHVEGVERRTVAEGDGAVAEVEGADRGIAGHVPGGRVQRGAGDVGHRAVQYGAVGEIGVQLRRCIGTKRALQLRCVHVQIQGAPVNGFCNHAIAAADGAAVESVDGGWGNDPCAADHNA